MSSPFSISFWGRLLYVWDTHKFSGGILFKTPNFVFTYAMAETLTDSSSFIPNNFVLFLGDQDDPFLDSYLVRNYDTLSFELQKRGMQLIYFPLLQKEQRFKINEIAKQLQWNVPALNSLGLEELSQLVSSLIGNLSPENFYSGIIKKFRLENVKRPCLLRSNGSGRDTSFEYKSIYLHYQTENDLDVLFERSYQDLAIERVWTFSYDENLASEYDADSHFAADAKTISADLKEKIERIRGDKKYEVLAETVLILITILKDEKPEIFGKISPLLNTQNLIEPAVILSPIVVDRHYHIFLPVFGNMEIMMHPLSKAVYILFLRHLEGIRFKELYRHKPELIAIYYQITSRDVKSDIIKSIDDLVDMRNPSINQKCSRIREAFRNQMDDRTAKSYYITGQNGEAKMISLPPELIIFE